MEVDLRQEFDDLIRDYGHAIKYYRRLSVPCIVCNGENTGTCKVCYATGRKLALETHRVRRDIASIPEGWPRAIQTKPVGTWHVPAYLYFMRWDSNPRVLDLIVDNDAILEINLIEPLQGDKGRIEYYYVAAQQLPTKLSLLE